MEGTTWDLSIFYLENVSNSLVVEPTQPIPTPQKKCYSSQIERFLQVGGEFFFVETTTY